MLESALCLEGGNASEYVKGLSEEKRENIADCVSDIHFPFLVYKTAIIFQSKAHVSQPLLQMEFLIITKRADAGWMLLISKWTHLG